MGWSTSGNWQTREDVVNVLKHLSEKYILLDESNHGSEYYQLVEREDGERFIVVNLIQKLYGDYGYKTMDETMIPYYFNCPERILKQSTLSDAYSIEWRGLCRHVRSKKKEWARIFKSLKVNDVVTFSNDTHSSSFRFSAHSNKSMSQPIGYDVKTNKIYRYPLTRMLGSWDNITVTNSHGE